MLTLRIFKQYYLYAMKKNKTYLPIYRIAENGEYYLVFDKKSIKKIAKKFKSFKKLKNN